jgi:purine-binding chemotaxis protein CheW
MTPGSDDVHGRLAELRSAFDAAFAAPGVEPQHEWVEFLVIVAGGQRYALRLAELAGLQVDRKVVPVPVDGPALLGLCSVRGHLVPVFDLAALLGTRVPPASPRWIALHRDTEVIGLAFDGLHETRRVATRDVRPRDSAPEDTDAASSQERAAAARTLSRHAIRVDGRVIHVLDVPAVVSTIRQAVHRG